MDLIFFFYGEGRCNPMGQVVRKKYSVGLLQLSCSKKPKADHKNQPKKKKRRQKESNRARDGPVTRIDPPGYPSPTKGEIARTWQASRVKLASKSHHSFNVAYILFPGENSVTSKFSLLFVWLLRKVGFGSGQKDRKIFAHLIVVLNPY